MLKLKKYDDGLYSFESENFDLKTNKELIDRFKANASDSDKSPEWTQLLTLLEDELKINDDKS